MTVRPMLGDWEVPNVAAIHTGERRRLVELPVPGRVGSLFQDLDTVPARIVVAGSLYGDEARGTFSDEVRRRFRDGTPLTFVADVVTATSVEYVVIESLEVAETGEQPEQLAYRIVLRESPPPPPPNPLAGVDAGLLDQAQGLLDSVTGALDLIDALGSAPDLGDPTAGLAPVLDGFDAATGGLPESLDSLGQAFAGAPAPDAAPLAGAAQGAQAGLAAAAAEVPGADALLGGLPATLGELAAATPSAAEMTAPLVGMLSGAAADAEAASGTEAGAARAAASLGALRDRAAGSALGELALAAGESRSLEEIVLEQAPDLEEQLLGLLTATRDGLLSPQALGEIGELTAALSAFGGELPDDPAALADLLSDTLLGVPADLLSGLAAAADPLLAELAGAVDAVGGGEVALELSGWAGELSAAAAGVGSLDLASEAGLRAQIELLAGLRARLVAAVEALGSGFASLHGHLDAVDLAAFEAAYRAALGALPAFDPGDFGVSSLERLKEQLLAPIEAAADFLATSGPDAVAAAFRARLEGLAAGVDRAALDTWQGGVVGFFEDLRERIEEIDLAAVRRPVEEALTAVRTRVDALGEDAVETLAGGVEQGLEAVEAVLDGLDLAAVQQAAGEALAGLGAALDGAGLGELFTQLDATLAAVEGFLADLVAQTSGLGEEIETAVGSLGDLDFAPVTDAVIAEIEGVAETLRGIDPDSLSPPARVALTAAVAVLSALDFEVTVTGALLARYDEVAVRAAEPLSAVAAGLDGLIQAVAALDPAVAIAPLSAPFDGLRQALDGLDPAALLAPLEERLATVRSAVEALSPTALAAPLVDLFAALRAALDRLSPAALLAPVVAVFDGVDETLRRLDLGALLARVDAALGELFDRARAALVDHLRGLGLPAPVEELLTSLLPLLDLLSPAALRDPLRHLVATLDTTLASLRPGALFQPLDDLYQELVRALTEAADEDVLAAFERVRSALVEGLGRLDPGPLAATVAARLSETRSFAAELDPEALAARLATPYGELAAAFERLDEAAVPAPLQPLFAELADLVEGLDPQAALAPLAAPFAAATASLDAAGDVDLADLAGQLDERRRRLGAAVPDFLRRPPTRESIAEALAELSPARCGDALDAAFDRLRTGFAAHRDRLLAEVEAFHGEHGALLAAFDVTAVAARIEEVYAAILAQLGALDPRPIVAELEEIFAAVTGRLDALDPALLVARLEESFERVAGKLGAFDLEPVETALEEALGTVRDRVALLDPARLLAEAGATAAFEALQEELASISAARVLEQLAEALAELRGELEEELARTAAAFRGMVGAIPSGLSAGVSL